MTRSASQAEVIRERVDELQRATAGSEAGQGSPENASSTITDADDGLFRSKNMQSPIGTRVEPAAETSRRDGNSFGPSAVRGKLDLSDSPTNAALGIRSGSKKIMDLSRRKADVLPRGNAALPPERHHIQVSSDLSDLSEEEEQSPSLRSRGNLRDDQGGQKRTFSNSEPVRTFSLLDPHPARRSERSRYTTKSKETFSKHVNDRAGSEAEGVEAVRDDKAGSLEVVSLSTAQVPAQFTVLLMHVTSDLIIPSKKTKAVRRDKKPSATDDVDYDVLPGDDAVEPPDKKKVQSKPKQKLQNKESDAKSKKPKVVDGEDDARQKRASKRKSEVEQDVSKKRKLSPSAEDNNENESPGPSRPSRKAGGAAMKKTRAMLRSSSSDQSQECTPARSQKKSEHDRELGDLEAPKDYLVAAASSTPQKGQNPEARKSKRPVDPWNRPSQHSEPGLVSLRRSDQHAARRSGSGSPTHEDLAGEKTIDIRSTLDDDIPISKAAGGNTDLPMAESPFGRTEETQGRLINNAGLDLEAFEHIALGPSERKFDNAACGEAMGLLEPAEPLDPMDDGMPPADQQVEFGQTSADAIESQREEDFLREFIDFDGLDDNIQNNDHAGDTAIDAGSELEELQTEQKEKICSGPSEKRPVAATKKLLKCPTRPATGMRNNLPELRFEDLMAAAEGTRAESPDRMETQKEIGNAAGAGASPGEAQSGTTRNEIDPVDNEGSARGNLLEGHGPKDDSHAARRLDFSAIDLCAGSSTLVEPKSASAPVPKLHVARRSVPLLSKAKLSEIRGRQTQNPHSSQERSWAADIETENSLRRSDTPCSGDKRTQNILPDRISSFATHLPARESHRKKQAAKVRSGAGADHTNDPALMVALLAARKYRQEAHLLRQDRQQAAEAEEQVVSETSSRIESLAIELAKAICKAELRPADGRQLQARHDLRALMQELYAELGALEDQDIEAVGTIETLRDCFTSTRERLQRNTGQIREQTGRSAMEVRDVIKKLRTRPTS
ncbi:hypothetical protein A4X09_0g6144 [Tilletia walkeri]|uniref:Uncharacterized protein n=1 Tax=Tilletia walkeri TaxID=117179 RepID=A0A8X7T272_9BASI|nr:hypothetical protein A4X09_0g6144 [Tilletia walkeri]